MRGMKREEPNIVLIVCDDLCLGDLSCYGNPYVRTPNLDRLYAESVRLARYCSGPLCSPARASLMTGKYHYRTRVVDTYLGRSMMDPGVATLAEMLKERGYATGIFGKWHLGDCYPMRPQDKGFDEALVHRGGGIGQPGDWPGNGYFDPVLSDNGTPRRFAGYCADIFTGGAIEFIRRHAGREPFFALLATNTPHSPFEVDEKWTAGFADKGLPDKFAKIYGMVANIDWNVGRVLEALRLAGAEENTIVIFTSDHGPCMSALADGRSRFNCGLRGIKGQMYEGGIRVPHLWRWPGRLPAGKDVDAPAHPIDVVPTLLAAAGTEAPEDVDGINLLPLMAGEAGRQAPASAADRLLFMQWHRGDVPVRFRNCAVIAGNWKWYSVREDGEAELYDLAKDPYETTNLAPAHRELADRFKQAYSRWFDEMSSGDDAFRPPLIVVGAPEEPHTMLTRQDWRVHGEDGWGDEHYGHWEVEVREGVYDVVLTVNPAWSAGAAYIRFGNTRWALQAESEAGTFRRRGMPLAGGSGVFEAWVEFGGRRHSVRYVDIVRK